MGAAGCGSAAQPLRFLTEASAPKSKPQSQLSSYSEKIDERMEEGLTEKEAVAEIGSIEKNVSQVQPENLNTESVRKKRGTETPPVDMENHFLAFETPFGLLCSLQLLLFCFPFT